MRFKNYLNEANIIFNVDDRVEGKYIDGYKFIGSIKNRRFNSYNHNLLIYTIKLDNPYKGRDEILITWNVNNNRPDDEDAELKKSSKKISKSTINSQKKRELERLYKDLEDIPRIFGKGPKADKARKEVEDEIKKLEGN